MRLLLLDTCGELGSLALADNHTVLRERSLPARSASAQLVHAIREELAASGWPLRSLDAVGVVNGPGSFTGVRVGLAAAKGLCEVANLRLVTVSRLAVLLSLGEPGDKALAVLDAGRGEFYARSSDSGEELLTRELLTERAHGHLVLLAEDKLLTPLASLHTRVLNLSASHALPLVKEKLREPAEDTVETADANYVRHARTLYAAAPSTQPEGPA